MNNLDSSAFAIVLLIAGLWLVAAWVVLPFLLMRSLYRLRMEVKNIGRIVSEIPSSAEIVTKLEETNSQLYALRVELLGATTHQART